LTGFSRLLARHSSRRGLADLKWTETMSDGPIWTIKWFYVGMKRLSYDLATVQCKKEPLLASHLVK